MNVLLNNHIHLYIRLNDELNILNNKLMKINNILLPTRRENILLYLKDEESIILEAESKIKKFKNYLKKIYNYIRESCSTSCGYIKVCICNCVVLPCRCARPIACTRSKPIA